MKKNDLSIPAAGQGGEPAGSDLPVADERARLAEMGANYGLDVLPEVPEEILDPALVGRLSVEWARANCLLPVTMRGELCVLTADPSQINQQEYLSVLLGAELRPVLAPRSEILRSIEHCYYSRNDSAQDFLSTLKPEGGAVAIQSQSDDLLAAATEAPVTQLVNLILLGALKQGASDIHLEPYESKLCVRYRVDGVLYEQAAPPKPLQDALVSRLKVMAKMDIAERRLPQDGMARVRVGEREIDVRASTVPVAEGERVVLRLLDRDSALLPLDVLGMSEDVHAAFSGLLTENHGMIAVCGPTGSGKTTTLYAALGQMDAARKNILTIEDPIEYQLPRIGQIQVKPKIGLTFATGLRHILRQDPDIILVGEIRDLETAQIAVRAALTGHLVLTTLHTNDAAGAVVRLVDMGVEPYLLASCLRGVLAQRLVRRLCPKCRAETPADRSLPVAFAAEDLGLSSKTVWEPSGCELCLEGYRGRIGVFEAVVIDQRLQDVVRGVPDAEALRRETQSRGMARLADDGIRKALNGMTSLQELINAAILGT